MPQELYLNPSDWNELTKDMNGGNEEKTKGKTMGSSNIKRLEREKKNPTSKTEKEKPVKKNKKQGSEWYEVQTGKISQGSGCAVDSGHWFANMEISTKYNENSFNGMMEAKTQLE